MAVIWYEDPHTLCKGTGKLAGGKRICVDCDGRGSILSTK